MANRDAGGSWARVRRGVVAAVATSLLLALQVPGIGQPKKLNPYTGKPDAIQEGRGLFLQYGCSGCHGVMGGGGMGPPLLDPNWKFGGDDDTLLKLIKGQISQQTMPKAFTALPDDQVWKLIAYIRSLYRGDASRVVW
jgi:mono/diheme cytochrome c family protein